MQTLPRSILVALGLSLTAATALGQAGDSLQAYRIDDWRAVSDRELIISANNGRRYRALLMGSCPGLRFTDRIAFVTRGERRIDRFAGIQLPDGTRCLFRSFAAVSSPADAGREAAPPAPSAP
jgi:hypothetical protein